MRPPAVGATLVSVDEGSVEGRAGRREGRREEELRRRRRREAVAGDAGGGEAEGDVDGGRRPAEPARRFYDYLRNQKPTRDTLVVDSKDVDEKLSARGATSSRPPTSIRIRCTARSAASCAVADVQGDKATIWSPTQAVYPLRSTAAMLLGLQPENVRVDLQNGLGLLRHQRRRHRLLRRGAAVAGRRAGRCACSSARKDEMAWENYGLAYVIDQRVGLDADGNIVAWDHEAWSPTLGGRPGTNTPGNVVTGLLAGLRAGPVRAANAGAGSDRLRTTAATPRRRT